MNIPARLSPHVPRFSRPITTSGVMFGLPAYGGQIFDPCMTGLRETRDRFAELGIGWNIITVRNESLIQRARHLIIAAFLRSPCDRLFFIDADIGFTADQVLRILAHDRDVIGGIYRKKTLDREDYAVNLLPNPDGTVLRDDSTGALRARHVATGFLCIKRQVLERMISAFPQLRYRLDPASQTTVGNEYAHALMEPYIDPVTLDYNSEDWAFCERWRAIGGECWVDPGLILEHWGTLCLTGDPMAHFLTPEPAACPTPSPPLTTPSSQPSGSKRRIAPAAKATVRR